MKFLLSLFGAILMAFIVLIFSCAEAIVDLIITRVDWPLVFCLAFSLLMILTFRKRKTYNRHG